MGGFTGQFLTGDSASILQCFATESVTSSPSFVSTIGGFVWYIDVFNGNRIK